MRRGLLLAGLCLALLALPARAAEEVQEQVWDSVDTTAVEQQAEDVLEIPLSPEIDLESGLASVFSGALERLREIVAQATRSAGLILVIALFCSLAQALCESAAPRAAQMVQLVGVLAVTAASVGDVHSLLSLGRETVIQLTGFTRVLIPVMTAAAAAGGSVTGAAARQMVTLFAANLLLSLIQSVLIPLVYLYVAACAGAVAADNDGLRSLAAFVRWVVQTVLTWVLLIFTAYLSLSGVIAGTADRAAVKLARFAISGMVPVVGGILSDATESVLAGAGILRNAIGIFGTLAVLAFCLVPFLQLGVQYLMYRISAVLTAAMTQSRLSGLIGDIGGAFGLMLGMVGACALLALIAIITTVAVAVS